MLYHHKFTAGGPHFCGLSIAFSAPQALLLFCLFWCCSIAFFALSTVKRQEEGKKCSGLPKYDNNILCINAKVGFWKNLFSEVVSVVYWGASTDKFYIEDKNITKRNLHLLGIDGPYFVSISCAHPRKNIRILLKAFQLFLQINPKHKLVLVWSNPPQDILQTYAKEISDLKIVFLKYVSDEYLRSLYNGATLTMYPSRSEGFGFPILESFACGTPVMTCRNSCLQEIGRDVALYVGEDNVDEMVDVMKYFEKNLFNMELFKKMSNNLLPSFSWDETASKYVDFYTKSLLL